VGFLAFHSDVCAPSQAEPGHIGDRQKALPNARTSVAL
jgi:hypothetical protein